VVGREANVNLTPFLQRTGQLWKFLLGCGVATIGLLIIFAMLRLGPGTISDDLAAAFLIGANVANVCAAVWMLRAIKCPQCRARLLWHAIREQHPKGLHWLFTFVACPYCRFQPDPTHGSASATERTTS